MGYVGYGMVWLSLWTQNNQNNQRTGSWSHFFKGNTLCLDFTDRLVNQPHFLTTRQLVLTRNLMVTYGDHDRVLAEFQTRRLVAGINTEWIHFHNRFNEPHYPKVSKGCKLVVRSQNSADTFSLGSRFTAYVCFIFVERMAES